MYHAFCYPRPLTDTVTLFFRKPSVTISLPIRKRMGSRKWCKHNRSKLENETSASFEKILSVTKPN